VPCSTCSATMESLGDFSGGRYFHCQRCGTLKFEPHEPSGLAVSYVPALVRRCLDFESILNPKDYSYRHAWHTLGIAESVALPENRMTP
jgi:hypothetical protein